MNRTASTLFALAAALCMAPHLARAQDVQLSAATTVANAECARAAHHSSLERRIVEKAAQGIVPLHEFVWRTRMIYQLDTLEMVAWLDQRRAVLAACDQRSARMDAVSATQ